MKCGLRKQRKTEKQAGELAGYECKTAFLAALYHKSLCKHGSPTIFSFFKEKYIKTKIRS